MQKIKLQNFVNDFRNNNFEYNKVKQAIEGQIEFVLTDRSRLVRTAIPSVIELLRTDPQKFHSFYYNQSTTQPENNEDLLLVEAEQLYEKMLENITNRIATSLSNNISSVSTFAQQELGGKQAFHPNFDTIENSLNYTTNAQC